MAQLKEAQITLSILSRANLTYADLSNSFISECDFSMANVFMAKMHESFEEKCIWSGANKSSAQGTNEQLKKAEQWGK